MRKYKRKPILRYISLLCVLLILIALVLKVDDRLRFITNSYAENKGKILANTVINKTVSRYLDEHEIKYSDIIKISSTGEGRVTSVEFNTVILTKLKSGIVAEVQKDINSSKAVMLEIPIGTVTGNQYLNNRGPKIDIEMQISSVVYSRISSRFMSAGINQTLHQITLDISADVHFIMPWYRSKGNYESEFMLAETIIVGDVPEAYTNVIESVGSDMAGDLFDFAAGIN